MVYRSNALSSLQYLVSHSQLNADILPHKTGPGKLKGGSETPRRHLTRTPLILPCQLTPKLLAKITNFGQNFLNSTQILVKSFWLFLVWIQCGWTVSIQPTISATTVKTTGPAIIGSSWIALVDMALVWKVFLYTGMCYLLPCGGLWVATRNSTVLGLGV